MTDEQRAMKNIVARLRRRAEDSGPLAARAYIDAANEIEKELRRLTSGCSRPPTQSANSEGSTASQPSPEANRAGTGGG